MAQPPYDGDPPRSGDLPGAGVPGPDGAPNHPHIPPGTPQPGGYPPGPYGPPPPGAGYPPGMYPPPPPPPPPAEPRDGNPGRTMLLVFLGVLLVLGGGIGVVLWLLRPQPVTYEALPDCDTLQESAVLQELVTDPQTRRDEFAAHEVWDDQLCEWRSSDSATGTRGIASVLIMRNDNLSGPGGQTGDEVAAQDLADEISDKDVEPVADLGDEAYAWYERDSRWGCVATRTDNIFVRTCYDAAEDFFDLESIPEDDAIAGAGELTGDVVVHIDAYQS